MAGAACMWPRAGGRGDTWWGGARWEAAPAEVRQRGWREDGGPGVRVSAAGGVGAVALAVMRGCGRGPLLPHGPG